MTFELPARNFGPQLLGWQSRPDRWPWGAPSLVGCVERKPDRPVSSPTPSEIGWRQRQGGSEA